MLEIAKEEYNLLKQIMNKCSFYTKENCNKCPFYINFNNRGCIFNQGRAPEFWDTYLITPINKIKEFGE